MKALKVIHRSAEIHVKLRLARMITDWRTAQIKFMSGATEHFGSLHPIRPENLRESASGTFAENHCACEMFGGACRIVLSPGELGLTIANANRSEHPIVEQILRRSWSWFSAEYELGWSSFESKEHPVAHEADAIDPYLNQFALAEIAAAANTSDGSVEYQPSARVVLLGRERIWVLRRLVEKSEMINNGVFVDTYIEIRSPDVVKGDLFTFLGSMDELADRTVGLHYLEG